MHSISIRRSQISHIFFLLRQRIKYIIFETRPSCYENALPTFEGKNRFFSIFSIQKANINRTNMIINARMPMLWQIGAAFLLYKWNSCYLVHLKTDFIDEHRNIHHNHAIHSTQFHFIWSIEFESRDTTKKRCSMMMPKLITCYYWFWAIHT